ncbi:hypothetical protein K505DRAFT_329731 [Melanomma pulvis-pyrius CBS 109.77]|uniref:Uncharacterized protein n=1 Tax=Melanomma pulvis-pyrius CBS 109.77 TaxID=1314802 RepID=A0A6A6WTV1_9PLEO|nr:hypothetical protein K505DRAFT_329731 [Melanomma pulvis-pyrius CBS 109.77]
MREMQVATPRVTLTAPTPCEGRAKPRVLVSSMRSSPRVRTSASPRHLTPVHAVSSSSREERKMAQSSTTGANQRKSCTGVPISTGLKRTVSLPLPPRGLVPTGNGRTFSDRNDTIFTPWVALPLRTVSVGTPVAVRRAMSEDMKEMREKLRPLFVRKQEVAISTNAQKKGEIMRAEEKTLKDKENPQKKISTPSAKQTRVAIDGHSQPLARSQAHKATSQKATQSSASRSMLHSARTSMFDPVKTSSASSTPRKSTTYFRRSTPSTPKSTRATQSPLNETPRFASAQDISEFVRRVNTGNRDPAMPKPSSSFEPPRPSRYTPFSPSPLGPNTRQSYTPKASPSHSRSSPRPFNSLKSHPGAGPGAGTGPRPFPSTPLRKSMLQGHAGGAVRTPSKEIQSSLDRAIDRQIEVDERAGRGRVLWGVQE